MHVTITPILTRILEPFVHLIHQTKPKASPPRSLSGQKAPLAHFNEASPHPHPTLRKSLPFCLFTRSKPKSIVTETLCGPIQLRSNPPSNSPDDLKTEG